MPAKNRLNVVLGEALCRARKTAGISQEQLAFDSKVDRTYISELENGHKSASVDVLFRMCPVLGMAASEFIAEVERGLQTRRK